MTTFFWSLGPAVRVWQAQEQKQLSIILVQCNGRQEANGRSTTVAGRQIKMPNILAFSSKNGQRLIALLEGILENNIYL